MSPGLAVRVRNAAVYLIYRRQIGVAMVATIAAIVSLLVMQHVVSKDVPPQYIPITEDGRLLPVTPTTEPGLDQSTVGQFALETIQALYTFDYINWKDQIARAENYFSPAGWSRYESELQRSNLMVAVQQRKMIVTARPTDTIRFLQEGVSQAANAYVWIVEVPVEIRFIAHAPGQSGGTDPGNRLSGVINMVISRVPMTDHRLGLAVQIFRNPSGAME